MMVQHRKNHFAATILCLCCLGAMSSAQAQSATDQTFQLPVCGKLPVPTQMHGSAVVGDRFYIFGGDTPPGWSNEVHSARISPQAQLSDWRREKEMPERRAYLVNSVEVVNDRVYIVGGTTAPDAKTGEDKVGRSQDVLWARVSPDGVISEWKRSEKFPGQPLSLLAACSDDKHLYVTGGSTGNVMSNAIHIADFAADGSPSNWRSAGILPRGIRFHGAAIQNGRLYTWGGQHSPSRTDAMKEVYSAPLKDGLVGQWRTEPEMPAAVYSSSSCGFNDYLIAVGGRYVNAYPTNSLWFARLNRAGDVTPWTALKTNLDTRVYHSLGLDKTRGFVFISGGKNKITPDLESGNIIDTVAIFQLTQSTETELKPEMAKAAGATTFADLDSAISAAGKSGKSVLVFLYAPGVPDCRRAWDNVIQTPNFQALGQRYEIALVDVSAGKGAEAPRRLSVFRVPSLVELTTSGQVKQKTTGVRSWADVEQMLKAR